MYEPQDAGSGELQTFRAVLELFGTRQVIADGLVVHYDTVASWRRRDFVPWAYHQSLVDLAQLLGIGGFDLEDLRRLAFARLDDRHTSTREKRARRAAALRPQASRRQSSSCSQRPTPTG